jgi:ubiquinone/menaquinone biosynthesis C-methylase UbiE
MAEASRHDSWQTGESYDIYMGRWSRRIAPLFLDWLGAAGGLDWLDVGCGTGALTATILAQCKPANVLSIDPSEGFLARALENAAWGRATLRLGDTQALPVETASRDIVVSGLMLNFVPDKVAALAEMKRATRIGGTIALYVWDYPGGGVEFINAFWQAAAALDPVAADLAENRRFPYCTSDGLAEFAENAGLGAVECTALVAPTLFKDFDDYWHPFTLGHGLAPGYCAKLETAERQLLKELLRETLPFHADGSIMLKARAWALKTKA